MSKLEYTRANCHFCGYLCGFVATKKDGRVVDLNPDPTRYPYDANILSGCRRWKMNLEMLDDPARINYPLKRVGSREDAWFERISWDEALDDIANRLKNLQREYGSEALASMIGGPHAVYWPLHRFMNLFGSPNNVGIGQICWNPRIWMDIITFGWTVEADLDLNVTDCVVIWGTNPAQSDNSLFWQELIKFSKKSIPFIVVDPRLTQTATLASLWVPIRPGTDVAFALGIIREIIQNDIFDHKFVNEWCYGFDELKEACRDYTLQFVSQTCGIDEGVIKDVACSIGKAKSMALISGRGIDQNGKNVAPTHRAICALRAITGNIDKQGSCVLLDASDYTSEADMEMTSLLSREQRQKCLNTSYTPLQCYEGYEKVNALTMQHNKKIPARYLTSAHPDLVLHAIEKAEPYPIRALIVQATNPLLTYGDSKRVFKALMSLDLIVVLEYYMTPTASIADYVLPVACALERPCYQSHGGVANIAYGGDAATDPYYERKVDYDVFRELGLRLGQEKYWAQKSLKDDIGSMLMSAGQTWEEFCETGIYYKKPAYKKHEILDENGNPRGFATKTKKIELASEMLCELGGPRVPTYTVLQSLCCEQTLKKGVHLDLITGARRQPYNASMYFNNKKFRQQVSYPVVEISQNTADIVNVKNGDVVIIATDMGQAKFVIGIAKMRDGLASADYGWWHPEYKPGVSSDFGGMWESSINCLTSCDIKDTEQMIGTWRYNAIDCVMWKCDEGISFDKSNIEQML